MRVFWFLFLLIFLAAMGAFAFYNQEAVTLRFWNWTQTMSLALVVGAAYVLGMLSGWSVVGMLHRSLRRVTSGPSNRA
jgi:uncharacterized integral membrane protein